MITIPVLAAALWEARNYGVPVPKSMAQCLNSIDDAYRCQRHLTSLSNMSCIGWKVGATSKAVQNMVGTNQPTTAPMFKEFCYNSGDNIPIFETFSIGIESEFSFRFSGNLPSRVDPYKREEILDAVDCVIPALEVVGVRFQGGFKGIGAMLLTADMAANSEWIEGTPQKDWRQINFKDYRVELFKDGIQMAEGFGANALGDPLYVLEWTANHLSQMGYGIKQGEIVSTGTCTGVVPVSPGETLVAEFGGLGRVQAHFTART